MCCIPVVSTVGICLWYDSLLVCVCWCLVVQLDVMDDPGKLGVSTPALMNKV